MRSCCRRMGPTPWSTASRYRSLVPRLRPVSEVAMPKRQSINGSKPRHENPIPNASRVGNLVMSSVIVGTNSGTRELPPSLEAQIANVFAHIRHDIEAAGGSVDDLIKVTFWVHDPASQRVALNTEWVKLFPDPQSRPARHTLTLPSGSRALVQADFVAVLSSVES